MRANLLGGLKLVDVDLIEPVVPELALLLQLREFTDLDLEWEVRVDAVQLVQVRAVDAELAEAEFDILGYL